MSKIESILESIAMKRGIETLETRDSDELDFHNIAVWKLKEMMLLAFLAGRNEVKNDR